MLSKMMFLTVSLQPLSFLVGKTNELSDALPRLDSTQSVQESSKSTAVMLRCWDFGHCFSPPGEPWEIFDSYSQRSGSS